MTGDAENADYGTETRRPSGCECELGGMHNRGGPCMACHDAGFETRNGAVISDD